MNTRTRITCTLALAVALLGAREARADWGPDEIHVQGTLTNLADEPVPGPVDLTLTLYDGPEADAVVLFAEEHASVPLAGGRFDVLLGAVEDLGADALFEIYDAVWLGVAVDGAAELPRAPLASVGYAMQARHAVRADVLAVGDCQPGEILAVSLDGTAWVCAADQVLTEAEVAAIVADLGYVLPGDLADVAFSGDFMDLVNVPAGLADGDDTLTEAEVEAFIADDGYALEAALAEVASSGSFEDLKDIPPGLLDGDSDLLASLSCPPGQVAKSSGAGWACGEDTGISYIPGPGIAISESHAVSVNFQALDALYVNEGQVNGVTGPMLANAAVTDAKVADVAWSKLTGVPAGLGDGDDVGLLVEVDPSVGGLTEDTIPRWDGASLEDGSVTDDGATVTVGAVLDLDGHRVADVAAPVATADAATKGYVDGALASLPTVIRATRPYTVVMGLASAAFCPAGWTVENFDDLKGPNNYLHLTISTRGLFLGGLNNPGYGDKYIYARLPDNNANVLCHRTFQTASDRPHLAVELRSGGNEAACRQGWSYLPAAQLRAGGTTGYLMTSSAGAYLGHLDTWARSSHANDEQHAVSYRYFTTQVDTLCMKVMGVDEDPATANGVLPAFFGVQNETDCPAGWNVETTSTVDGSDNYFYLQVTDNSTFAGGEASADDVGANYLRVQFAYSQVNFVCWSYLPVANAQPYVQIRTPHTGACPSGYLSFNATAFKGWNDNGYIGSTGHGLYMGGLYTWALRDDGNGFIQHSFTTQVNNKVCLRLDNVTL
ncbi:MAG: hypothetical protein FJ098_01365 [Deltaproteobacteria bacterium]|nr:hypothetical protein [Deltaproteobacteria bacterium]